MPFKQNYFLEKIEYNFYDKGIIQTYKSLFSKSTVNISFEDIGKDITRVSSTKKPWFIASMIFLALSVFMFLCSFSDKTIKTGDYTFWFVPAVVCFLVFTISKKEKVFLTGDKDVMFFYKKREVPLVQNFINEIIQKRNEYYKAKYAIIETHLTVKEQINKFRWLKNQEIITTEEFEDLITTLQSKVSKINHY